VAKVVLPASVGQQFAGGESEFEIEGASVRAVIRALDSRHPGLGAAIEEGMAIAIDGEIFQDPYLEPVGADSELYILPKIGGG
jgi:molybdopterin converting factor small subunit